jgi:hypothetical protein
VKLDLPAAVVSGHGCRHFETLKVYEPVISSCLMWELERFTEYYYHGDEVEEDEMGDA